MLHFASKIRGLAFRLKKFYAINLNYLIQICTLCSSFCYWNFFHSFSFLFFSFPFLSLLFTRFDRICIENSCIFRKTDTNSKKNSIMLYNFAFTIIKKTANSIKLIKRFRYNFEIYVLYVLRMRVSTTVRYEIMRNVVDLAFNQTVHIFSRWWLCWNSRNNFC